ncbi:MAG TPA: dipeptidase [Bryobacteraceae bacterium]|nr:dipeptidase [Bryobacteraceae bacterium]
MRASLILALAAASQAAGQRRPVTAEMVREVQRTAILIDTHNDVTSRTVDGFDIGKRAADGYTDIPRLRAGGVGAVFFAAYVPASYAKDHSAAHRALDMIDTVRHDIVAMHPNDFVFATNAAEIEAAHRVGKIAALIGIEGGHALEDDPRLLRDFYALGVRYVTLTHTNTNNWADSSGDMADRTVRHHDGLTDLGRRIVGEMNRLGMMVDISHVSDKTFQDVLAVSTAPVIASHSSCRALANVPRNMSDEMIVALAKKGGVIQINLNCEFLSQASADSIKGRPAKNRKPAPATLADVVAHIDHVVKIAGIGAVGIGSDFDGVTCTPTGLEDVSKFPNLTRALLEKGYSPDDIRKIYGGNTLRLMRTVERLRQPS